jgi:hypothetical protein
MPKLNTVIINSIIVLASLISVACSGGGGGGGTNTPPPEVAVALYPSAPNTVYSADRISILAGQSVTFTVNIKDQLHNPFSLGTNWKLGVEVDCPSCANDVNIKVSSVASSGPVQTFTFTPKETNDYSVQVNFTPTSSYTNYFSDFSGGVSPDQLYTVGLNIPPFDVCTANQDPALHGLRGTTTIAGVVRMAVCSPSDMTLIASDSYFLDKDLYLAKAIDMASVTSDIHIGNDCSDPNNCALFAGSFYGNNLTISNFKRTTGLGLFGILSAAKISYLKLDKSVQSGGADGGLIAFGMGGGSQLIEVSVTSSSITGTGIVGGLVGLASGASILHSKSDATVSSQNISGGLVGEMSSDDSHTGLISASFSSGKIHLVNGTTAGADMLAGGLIGTIKLGAALTDCYFAGQVTSAGSAGGLVGNLSGSINYSYVAGSVAGSSMVGGLIGMSDGSTSSSIQNSFSNAQISRNSGTSVAGLIGGSCSSLASTHISINGSGAECGQQNAYTSNSVSVGTYTSISAFVTSLQSLLSTWQTTIWNMPKNNFPIIR